MPVSVSEGRLRGKCVFVIQTLLGLVSLSEPKKPIIASSKVKLIDILVPV